MLKLGAEEFRQQFGVATERRVELHERFSQWLSVALSTSSLRRLWIFGSFASSKPGPGDLDILALFAADFNPARLAPSIQHWFDHELCRELHEIDLFWVTESLPADALDLVVITFSRDRTGQETMIEVTL